MPNIKLKTDDDQIHEVDIEIAKVSTTIKNMLEVNLGAEDNDNDDEAVPVAVKSSILQKILEWAEHHRNDPPREVEEDPRDRRNEDIDPWDENFLRIDNSSLFELMMAANFLDINELLNTACLTVANMMRGKTPEEIRLMFNIENDFLPGEEDQIRKENEWCEEK